VATVVVQYMVVPAVRSALDSVADAVAGAATEAETRRRRSSSHLSFGRTVGVGLQGAAHACGRDSNCLHMHESGPRYTALHDCLVEESVLDSNTLRMHAGAQHRVRSYRPVGYNRQRRRHCAPLGRSNRLLPQHLGPRGKGSPRCVVSELEAAPPVLCRGEPGSVAGVWGGGCRGFGCCGSCGCGGQHGRGCQSGRRAATDTLGGAGSWWHGDRSRPPTARHLMAWQVCLGTLCSAVALCYGVLLRLKKCESAWQLSPCWCL
jgi:hypothetical protein